MRLPMQLMMLSLVVHLTATARADELASDEEVAVRAAVAKVADSVVQIRTIGGLEEVDRTLLPDGPTTGLVISPDGWIVSSSFNFVQQPASILVTFASGAQAPATLVAKDHSRMLVLLKAQGVEDLPVPELAPADEVRVGQWAIAVGRMFRADRPNVSVGIVSALGRMFGKAIQTDADVSMANYGGPLVDIRGRVLGVLVPIAPQTTSEVAGAEWYDSGIGFAVPLSSVSNALERMKRGEDQHAGLLGISLAAGNAHEQSAELTAVPPNTPAGKAGLRKGDRIVEIDGRSIRTQTDLRFALGPLYAGEEVRVVAQRGDERLEQTITLTGELEPFRHAFLGILPMRDATPTNDAKDAKKEEKDDAEAAGVAVRMVYAGSPAAEAGVRPGDRIVQIDDAKIANVGDAIAAMNGVSPGAEIGVTLLRDGQEQELSLTATRLPTTVPNDLPPAVPQADGAVREGEIRELKLAEFAETCRVYVPASHEAGRPAGVLLCLHAPGAPPDDELFRRWRSICDRDGLLLVVPTAADPSRWERTELEYLRRLIERVLADYRVDRSRVVVFGQDGGGAMAYLLALVSRDIVTGVATSDAAVPRTVRVPPNDPSARLAVYAGLPSEAMRLAQIRQGLKKLSDAGYPATATAIAGTNGRLSAEDEQQLARWIDTLDRF